MEGENRLDALSGVLERGKGAVIVCMHFGNWDLAPAPLQRAGTR